MFIWQKKVVTWTAFCFRLTGLNRIFDGGFGSVQALLQAFATAVWSINSYVKLHEKNDETTEKC